MTKKNRTMEMRTVERTDDAAYAEFFERVAGVIENARRFVGRTVDITMTVTYFAIGQMIFEQEQAGQARADYGQRLIINLSRFLTERFKRGFSIINLKNARFFYKTYSPRLQIEFESNDLKKGQTVSAQLDCRSDGAIGQTASDLFGGNGFMDLATRFFRLSWSHYSLLMRIENEDERRFYEIEAEHEGWSYRFLKRQYNSSLYERLALSKDKEGVRRLAREGQTLERPDDILKSPLVLEFLGMREDTTYSETELETALISKLQEFLLELGKGFLFDARQKRFTFEDQSFFVDLVFYNRLLQCFVLIDLKTDELRHQDLGQMQMYVNYFDRFVRRGFERPTIGILLCKKKNNSIVELTLPQDAHIYASEYSLYLPDKEMLQLKLAEWGQEFEDERNGRSL